MNDNQHVEQILILFPIYLGVWMDLKELQWAMSALNTCNSETKYWWLCKLLIIGRKDNKF